MNPRSMTATQASLLHNEYPDPSQPNPEAFPAMIWGTNYSRLASQTLFTLFFAGRAYAPKCIIDGVNIQDYLQNHFINAVAYLARRIRETGGLLDECIIGWDPINEPSEGLVGYEDLRKIPPQQALKKGSAPTVAQSLRLGVGRKQEDIEWWDFGSFGPRRNGSVDIDPRGVKLWVDPDLADEKDGVNGRWGWKRSPEWKLGECIWALHGVWDPSLSTDSSAPAGKKAAAEKDADILFPDYFLYKLSDGQDEPNRKVNFVEDHFLPHLRLYFGALRDHHPELIPFIQTPVFHPPPWLNASNPQDPSTDLLQGRGCFSTHYYDGLTLMTRHWNWFNADALGVLRGQYSSPVFAVKIGDKAIRKSIREQLGVLKADCLERMGAYPTVFGEIGIPMELDDQYAYGGRDGKGKGKGDYREHVKALDASLFGADGDTGCGYTIWTYCAGMFSIKDSCIFIDFVLDGSHKWGDGWNGEDLSLWCIDDERAGGSVTGRRELVAPRQSAGVSGSRQEKDRARMIVRPAADDDEESVTDAEEQSAKPGDVVGYQVSSASITLDDLVRTKDGRASLTNSATLTDPTSSKATLVQAFAKADATSNSGPLSLTFPSFKSAPFAFAFLTNGARAWKAFVRAYPLAVVGLPIGWEWDITRAAFELKVRVGPNDRAGLGDSTTSSDSEFVVQEEATEVFVPLLHFAKDDIVKRAFGIPVASSRARGKNTPPAPGAVPVSVPLLNDVSTVSLSIDSAKARPSNQSIELDTTPASRSTSQERNEEPGMDMEDALDLEVTVNGGRWTVDGQVLKWWYPIPTTASSQASDLELNLLKSQSTTSVSKQRPSTNSSRAPPKVNPDGTIEYTITIQRRGGAIDFKRLGVPENWVGMGPRTSAQNKNVKTREGGNKAECCGDGCLIA